MLKPLPPQRLAPRFDDLDFTTTADLEPLEEILGRDRAIEALRFALDMPREGYNAFAFGEPGVGRHWLVRRLMKEAAAKRPVPPDQLYLSDFERPEAPRHLLLPAGLGRRLRSDLDDLVEHLVEAVPAAFESEDYRARKQELEQHRGRRQDEVLDAFEAKANGRGFLLLRSPEGLGLAPGEDGKPLSPAAIAALDEEQEAQLDAALDELKAELQAIVRRMPVWDRELRDAVRELDQGIGAAAVDALLDPLRESWAEHGEVASHLEALRADVVQHVQRFRPQPSNPLAMALGGGDDEDGSWARRYRANLLVDHGETEHAPVVQEERPSLANLLGRIEHQARLGTLVTDFTRIRPGALHRAHGGFLLLDAEKLVSEPYAWMALKEALRGKEVRIQSVSQAAGMAAAETLEPEPAPLDVKVVLVGSPRAWHVLNGVDPEFPLLFKVPADFEGTVARDDGADLRFARLLAQLIEQDGLRPFDRGAVLRVLRESCRRAADARRLSVHLDSLTDLLREADYRAGGAGVELVTAAEVDAAVRAQQRWGSHVRDRVHEAIDEGSFFIATEGESVGEVNGLSVSQVGRQSFGRPHRISARVRLGGGTLLDIEREVTLGGPIHSKGVLILAGFLGARFGKRRPLALSASLVFEQNYGGVDGDSASLAETCALLSALAELPVKQGLAVTGSIDQRGRVQAVGGVNEKIEGFFSVCAERGLTGEQGVLLPASNARNLVLRREVVQAVEQGRFGVWAVSSVEEAVELLTGVPAGKRVGDRWTKGSVMAQVDAALQGFADAARVAHGQGDGVAEPSKRAKATKPKKAAKPKGGAKGKGGSRSLGAGEPT